jgi:predicted aspartyl protease
MLAGTVTSDGEGVVRIALFANGRRLEFDAVVDTGFNGSLTLPPSLISETGLTFIGFGEAIMANGAVDRFPMYTATILWDDQERLVPVESADTHPLIGMSLLRAHEVWMPVVDGGQVTITPIRSSQG